MNKTELTETVSTIVADALALEREDVTGEATLLVELEAESIDLLDILFRIERQLGVKIEASDLADYVQGGLTDEVFGDEQHFVSERGFAHLVTVMPQIDVEALRGTLKGTQVMNLFTIDNLVQLVKTTSAELEAAS